jgi:hypothetical protein
MAAGQLEEAALKVLAARQLLARAWRPLMEAAWCNEHMLLNDLKAYASFPQPYKNSSSSSSGSSSS